mgnify:CR=1 FL=1
MGRASQKRLSRPMQSHLFLPGRCCTPAAFYCSFRGVPFLALNRRASAAFGSTVGLRNQCYPKVYLADALLNQRNSIRYSPLSTILMLAKVKTKNRQGCINGECCAPEKSIYFRHATCKLSWAAGFNCCCAAAEGLRWQAARRK